MTDAWTHAFDGLTVEGVDLGTFLREAPLDSDSEAIFRAVSERITELSRAVLEAGSGWQPLGAVPTDTGVATPDVQFVAVPIPQNDRIQVVYGPFDEAAEAIECAQGLSSDPDECYAVPVVAWDQ